MLTNDQQDIMAIIEGISKLSTKQERIDAYNKVKDMVQKNHDDTLIEMEMYHNKVITLIDSLKILEEYRED